MKNLKFALMASLALLSSCVLVSVAPFYKNADTLFDTRLVGDWLQTDDAAQHWKLEKAGDGAYQLAHRENNGAPVLSEAHLFKLGDKLFLDIAQNADRPADEAFPPRIPSHLLVRIDQLTPTLRAAILNYKWCVELLDKDPQALRHHVLKKGDKLEDRELVLTASTQELQKFILKHIGTEAAWSPIELQRAEVTNAK